MRRRCRSSAAARLPSGGRPGVARAAPPAHSLLAALPSLPPAELRRLRSEGRLERDFTSRLSLKRPRGGLPVLASQGTGCGKIRREKIPG